MEARADAAWLATLFLSILFQLFQLFLSLGQPAFPLFRRPFLSRFAASVFTGRIGLMLFLQFVQMECRHVVRLLQSLLFSERRRPCMSPHFHAILSDRVERDEFLMQQHGDRIHHQLFEQFAVERPEVRRAGDS